MTLWMRGVLGLLSSSPAQLEDVKPEHGVTALAEEKTAIIIELVLWLDSPDQMNGNGFERPVLKLPTALSSIRSPSAIPRLESRMGASVPQISTLRGHRLPNGQGVQAEVSSLPAPRKLWSTLTGNKVG
jgi:hypothetical protein